MNQKKFTSNNRHFIYSSLMQKMCTNSVQNRQFFLFNDVLCYGKPIKGSSRKCLKMVALPLMKMGVASLPDDEGDVHTCLRNRA